MVVIMVSQHTFLAISWHMVATSDLQCHRCMQGIVDRSAINLGGRHLFEMAAKAGSRRQGTSSRTAFGIQDFHGLRPCIRGVSILNRGGVTRQGRVVSRNFPGIISSEGATWRLVIRLAEAESGERERLS